MGYAVAQMAAERGAEVLLISGPSALAVPPNVKAVQVESTNEMLEACLAAYDAVDIVIKAAAVADYRPRDVADQKIKKKTDDALTVVMDKIRISSNLGCEENASGIGWLCCRNAKPVG